MPNWARLRRACLIVLKIAIWAAIILTTIWWFFSLPLWGQVGVFAVLIVVLLVTVAYISSATENPKDYHDQASQCAFTFLRMVYCPYQHAVSTTVGLTRLLNRGGAIRYGNLCQRLFLGTRSNYPETAPNVTKQYSQFVRNASRRNAPNVYPLLTEVPVVFVFIAKTT